MPVSCPFICSRAWLITSCKLPASSWKPHTATGCKHKAEGKQRCTATMATESPRMRAAPYHSCVALLFLLLFLLLQTRLEWPQDLGAVTRHPQRYAHRLRRTTRVGTGPRCRVCRACKRRRLTSTKKVRFSNNEGWVFNLPSLVSSKSPLHLLRMSVDGKRGNLSGVKGRELNSGPLARLLTLKLNN